LHLHALKVVYDRYLWWISQPSFLAEGMGCPVTTVVVVSVTVVEVIVEVMVVISPSIDKEERNGNEWGDQWDTFGYI
jgi:multisubunit Na+/H+ antiporter MnhB subunit